MSDEDPADVLARMRAKATARQARYRASNEAAAERDRRNNRIHNAAARLLRATFRTEYETLLAMARETIDGQARQAHYRLATQWLREAHPDEWQDALTTAKETTP